MKRKKYKIKLEDLSPKHQAEARAQGIGEYKVIPSAPVEIYKGNVPSLVAELTEAKGRIPRPSEAFGTPTRAVRDALAEPGAHEKKPRRRRKQAGREETQVHRDVRRMILSAWGGVEPDEECQFQLCEGHSYTVDFRLKAEGEVIWIEAKGPHTFEDSRVKFLWCMTQLRWAFFVWAKLRKNGVWYFEVWHAGSRLKMKGKRQNPRSMVECAELIKSTVEERDGE